MAKILVLANNDVGLYKFRKELLVELLNQGNDVFISLPYGELVKPLEIMGCKFINTQIDRRGINPIKDIKLLIDYYKVITKLNPDLVITYTIKPNVYGGIVSSIKKIPYVINITGLGSGFQSGGLLKKFVTNIYRFACKKAGTVFFENEENQGEFIDYKIIDEDRTCKLNGAGVNLMDYQFADYPVDGQLHILFIGRVMKEKGVDELFQVAEQIKKEYDNIVFDIVGPFEDDYKDTIVNLEKSGVINYHGYQKDVKPFIKKSHCFILPSYHEGMANTLLECGAMGRPLITSNIHGCKEAVIEGGNGFLASVKDSNDLYSKLKKFLDLPYGKKVEMGKCSRLYIENKFNRAIVVNKTIQEVNKLLK